MVTEIATGRVMQLARIDAAMCKAHCVVYGPRGGKTSRVLDISAIRKTARRGPIQIVF